MFYSTEIRLKKIIFRTIDMYVSFYKFWEQNLSAFVSGIYLFNDAWIWLNIINLRQSCVPR